MSIELQQAIKQQSEDLREELADLREWEDSMQRPKHKSVCQPDMPPIRGTSKPAQNTPVVQKEDPLQVAKEQGNEYFRRTQYDDAIRMYTKGISWDPNNAATHVLYANRAQCYLKLGMWSAAERDAATCIQMNRSYVKGYYRRALARKEIKNFAGAREDLEAVLALSPNDTDGERELKTITALLRQSKSESQPSTARKALVIEEIDDDEEEPVPTTTAQPDPQKGAKVVEVSSVEQPSSAEQPPQKAPEKVVPSVQSPQPAALDTRKVFIRKESLVPPKTFIEFEKTYSSVRSDADLLDAYLNLIPQGRLPSIIGSSLSPELLIDLLNAVVRMPQARGLTVLQDVSSIRRLSEIILFLEENESALVTQALDHVSASAALRAKFC